MTPRTSDTVVQTPLWRLRIGAGTDRLRRTICVPTIHPAGDQRVLRCAQAALDAGYDLHLVWLGGEPGQWHHHPRIQETRLPAARSTWQRLRAVPRVAALARRLDPDLWHIHDSYLLPFARRWTSRTGRPVVYDVHEYYPEYYARRNAVPVRLQPMVERAVAATEQRLARRLGGVDAVSETLATRFRLSKVPAVATPNYPDCEPLREAARPSTPQLLRRVIHTGSLSVGYGSEVLLAVARELGQLDPAVELILITRFGSNAARDRFRAALRRAGPLPNLRLVDPVPAHEVAGLLATAGIGLVANQDCGQFPLAVPTKLYEYAAMGLAVVASDLPAIRDFVGRHAVGRLVPPDQPEAYARAILELIAESEQTCAKVDRRAREALQHLSWERSCGPRLAAFLRTYAENTGKEQWPKATPG